MSQKLRIFAVALMLMFAGLACNLYTTIMCEVEGGYFDDEGECVVEDDSEWESMRSEEEFIADQTSQAIESQPETTQHVEMEKADPQECNAVQSLDLAVSKPEVNNTDYELRCKYTITYTNTGKERIWVFVHKTNKGADTEVEEVWKNYYSLKPGESLEMGYRTLLYKESGDTWIEVVTDVAPIFATEGCKNTFRNDVEPRSQISFPVEVPCE